MSFFEKPSFIGGGKKKQIPNGLFVKCPGCGELVHNLELQENQHVCPNCEHHFAFGARERLAHLLDPESFVETDTDLRPVDVLGFQGAAAYKERLQKYQQKTGLVDSVVCGLGKLDGREVSIAIMDFEFLGGSMGSVAGEKITRAIERATARQLPVIVISASGGARLYEGMFSLMQMAKTSGALALHSQARLPYISILTNPTTGGVTASFAMLGDLNIAEPGALIGFAGPRVIEQTIRQKLPAGFQRSEFLLEHGMLDSIVKRTELREYIVQALDFMMG